MGYPSEMPIERLGVRRNVWFGKTDLQLVSIQMVVKATLMETASQRREY